MKRTSYRHASALACAAMSLAGCQSVFRAPASASLSELTFETKSQSGVLFQHNQVTSITGLFPVPDVGLFIHYSNPRDPTTAIGISKNHSFKLVGTVGGEGDAPKAGFSDVVEAREQIAKAQAAAGALVANRSLQTTARAKTKKLNASKTDTAGLDNTIKDIKSRTLDDAGKKALAELQMKFDAQTKSNAEADTVIATLNTEISKLVKDEEQLNADLKSAETELATRTKKNGLIITRWETNVSNQTGVKALRFADIGTASSNALSGYIILAEPRVQMLFIGDDFLQFMTFLSHPEEFHHPGFFKVRERPGLTASETSFMAVESFPTYQLQAKHVAYTADRVFTDSFNASVHFALQDVVGVGIEDFLLDQITLDLVSKRLASLGNTGTISGVKWERQPYCFLAGDDFLVQQKDSNPRVLVNGWATILTQNVSMANLAADFLKFTSDARFPKKPGRMPCSPTRCAAHPEEIKTTSPLSLDDAHTDIINRPALK